jgi:hypothetical protein
LCTFEAELLDEIQTKVFRAFLLAIHSHLYSCALRYLYLQTVSTVEENLIENHTPFPDGLRNLYRNLKSDNSQDYAQKPQRNYTFMNPASVGMYRKVRKVQVETAVVIYLFQAISFIIPGLRHLKIKECWPPETHQT